MANKVAIAGSILGFLLAFFSSIPLGIVLAGGLTGLTGIPLDLYHSGINSAYIWGRSSGLTFESWFVVAEWGLIYGICLFILAIAAAALALGGAFVKGKAGRSALLWSFIFFLVVLGVSLVDWIVLGIGVAHATDAVLGGGMYLLITEVILLIVAFKGHPKDE
jgi:hypothetical protein